jgi:hypothetical protein
MRKTLDNLIDEDETVSDSSNLGKDVKEETKKNKFKNKSNLKLQVTKNYHLNLSQISRLLIYVSKKDTTDKISASNIVNNLGLPFSQVRYSIASMAVAFGLLQPRIYKLTELGRIITLYDTFFDDIGTLYILHYTISSEPRWVIWNYMINNVLYNKKMIDAGEVKEKFSFLKGQFSEGTIKEHVRKEISSFFDAYINRDFERLNLIKRDGNQYYMEKTKEIPELILLASILIYRERYEPKTPALQIETLVSAPNSPGRVFNIEESDFRKILEELHKKGDIYIESSADLDQVRFKGDIGSNDIIKTYYEGKKNG